MVRPEITICQHKACLGTASLRLIRGF